MPPSATPFRVAVAGASSLLGKELKQVLEDRNFPARETILLDESVMAGTLTEAGGEPTFLRALEEDSFEGARFVFFAGTSADTARNWPAAQRAGATVIDLTGATVSHAGTVRQIPALGSIFPPRRTKTNGSAIAGVYSSPSAPAIIACTLAAALRTFEPRQIALTLLAPISESDQPGIEELETQTASLLSFREISKTVFDAQIAFNVLTSYGPESRVRLGERRLAISRESEAFLAGRAPAPAIQLLHVPVFYGYAFSAYADFASPIARGDLEAAFKSLGVQVAAADDAPPSNVTVAGENEIHLAAIAPDENHPKGFWLSGAADNLRLAAVNAVRIAEELLLAS